MIESAVSGWREENVRKPSAPGSRERTHATWADVMTKFWYRKNLKWYLCAEFLVNLSEREWRNVNPAPKSLRAHPTKFKGGTGPVLHAWNTINGRHGPDASRQLHRYHYIRR